MHIYHFEEPGLTSGEVALLCEAFGIGSPLQFSQLDRARTEVQTAACTYELTTHGAAVDAGAIGSVTLLGQTYTCVRI